MAFNPPTIIESLDQEGRGVTHVDGKAIFIEGALPGEKVTYSSYRKKPTYEFARVEQVLRESPNRTKPQCPHFGVCGGCALQHLELSAQVASKQRLLEDNLWHIGKIKPEGMLPPIVGPAWGYRHKARLRARYVPMKGRVLVGFNEKHSSLVTLMSECHVLPPHVSALIVPMQDLLAKLSFRDSMPQVEVAVGEHTTVLVLRILQPIEPQDEPLMREFLHQRLQRHAGAVVAPAQGAGHRNAVPPVECAAAFLFAAGVRPGISLHADGVHAGQSAHQPCDDPARHGVARP